MCDMLHDSCSRTAPSHAAESARDAVCSPSNSVVGACATVLAAMCKCGSSLSICSHTDAVANLLRACSYNHEGTSKKALACVLQLSTQPSATK
jgi:hypothetical protein